jgi:hypothetical protein
MKKIFVLNVAVIVVLLAVGCGSSPSKQGSSQQNMPDWVSEVPSQDDVVWGIGFAKLEFSDVAMEVATTRAQRDAARQISVLVQGALIEHANISGVTDNTRATRYIDNVGRNIVNANLSGATVNKRQQMSDGTWYIRIAVRKTEVQRQVNSIVRNEMADFAEFQAERALQRLDSEINKYQSKPSPLGED